MTASGGAAGLPQTASMADRLWAELAETQAGLLSHRQLRELGVSSWRDPQPRPGRAVGGPIERGRQHDDGTIVPRAGAVAGSAPRRSDRHGRARSAQPGTWAEAMGARRDHGPGEQPDELRTTARLPLLPYPAPVQGAARLRRPPGMPARAGGAHVRRARATPAYGAGRGHRDGAAAPHHDPCTRTCGSTGWRRCDARASCAPSWATSRTGRTRWPRSTCARPAGRTASSRRGPSGPGRTAGAAGATPMPSGSCPTGGCWSSRSTAPSTTTSCRRREDRVRNRRLTTARRVVVQCSAWEIRHEPWEVIQDLVALGVPTLG